MKKTCLVSVFALSCVLLLSHCGGSGSTAGTEESAAAEGAAASTEAAAPAIHKYPVKSGIVTYDHSGFGLTTKTILYFDDYGTKEAEEKYDTDGSLKETNLCDGKNQYILIHKDKAAFKRGECYRGVAYKFDWNEAQRSGDEYKPTRLSNQNIAGKDCESFSLDISGNKTVYAGWNNICFLIETPAGNNEKIIFKAVSIEENAAVPAEKLKVPAGYTMN